jgi:hypothetical protein
MTIVVFRHSYVCILHRPSVDVNRHRYTPIAAKISCAVVESVGVERTALLQGTLDMLILRTPLLGAAHGHEIAKHIQRISDEVLRLEHGSLYPALHRLEHRGGSPRSGTHREHNRKCK